MKDWKKCTVFLLALVICLSLAACGVGSSESESEDYYPPGVIEDTDYDFTDDNPAKQLGYMMFRGGERVKAENLSAILDWYRAQQ